MYWLFSSFVTKIRTFDSTKPTLKNRNRNHKTFFYSMFNLALLPSVNQITLTGQVMICNGETQFIFFLRTYHSSWSPSLDDMALNTIKCLLWEEAEHWPHKWCSENEIQLDFKRFVRCKSNCNFSICFKPLTLKQVKIKGAKTWQNVCSHFSGTFLFTNRN